MAAGGDGGDPKASRPRLLVVGIDSSTYRILDRYVGSGELPAFARIMREGSRGVLMSTVPPLTPPGWVTSYTGVNPGLHGVFDFKDFTTYIDAELPYEHASTSGTSVRAWPFWHYLNQQGLSTGLVNLPMLYPVEPVDGYAIAGFPAGDDDAGVFYPAGLAEEVRRLVPDYTVYVGSADLERSRPRRYLERIDRSAVSLAELSLSLMRDRPTEVAFVAFTEVDRVQHFFWSAMDEGHPARDAKRQPFRDAILDHYRVIDGFLGRAIGQLDPGSRLLVYSDHGSAPLRRNVFLNTYLMQRGIMVMKGSGAKAGEGTPATSARERLLDRRRVERWFHRLGLKRLIHLIPKRIRHALPTVSFETVDWGRTRAFFSSPSGLSVTINLSGREPEGWVQPGEDYRTVRDEVVSVLRELRDPATGDSPFAAIHIRDELYSGPCAQNGPDIVLEPKEGYMVLKHLREEVFSDIGRGWMDRSSEHERQGIVLLWGPAIRQGTDVGERHIADIAPTVLHLSGATVPKHMEGRVIEEALEEGCLRDSPVRYEGDEAFVPREAGSTHMTPEEEELLKDRLRGLGYMG